MVLAAGRGDPAAAGARIPQPTGVRPGAIRAVHDIPAERHVAFPIPDARVPIALEISGAAGEHEHG
jgi:hypothetical protein